MNTNLGCIAVLSALGVELLSGAAAQAQALRADHRKWGDVIRDTGTTIEQ